MSIIPLKIERSLNFRIDGKTAQGFLKVGDLRKKESESNLAECWACSWSLSEIHPETAEVCGEDPLDALLNCLRLIRTLIENHKSIGYEVWWLAEGDCG